MRTLPDKTCCANQLTLALMLRYPPTAETSPIAGLEEISSNGELILDQDFMMGILTGFRARS